MSNHARDVIMQFKTKDGHIFETEAEAKEYASRRTKSVTQMEDEEQQREERRQTLEARIKELRQITEHEYLLRAKLKTECNCPNGQDYSIHCLEHFCTCQLESEFPGKEYEKVICSHHTNMEFKNTGCFWCRYSDCSKYHC